MKFIKQLKLKLKFIKRNQMLHCAKQEAAQHLQADCTTLLSFENHTKLSLAYMTVDKEN